MLIVWLTIVLSLMSFVEIDIIEKNQDDDTDDVEIERFLEDSNFEQGEDECEVVIALSVLSHILWLVLPNFAIFVF